MARPRMSRLALAGLLLMLGSLCLPVWIRPRLEVWGESWLEFDAVPGCAYLAHSPGWVVRVLAALVVVTTQLVLMRSRAARIPAALWLLLALCCFLALHTERFDDPGYPRLSMGRPHFAGWLAALAGGALVIAGGTVGRGPHARRLDVRAAAWPGAVLLTVALFVPLWTRQEFPVIEWPVYGPAVHTDMYLFDPAGSGAPAGPAWVQLAGAGAVVATVACLLARPTWAWAPAGGWLLGAACGLVLVLRDFYGGWPAATTDTESWWRWTGAPPLYVRPWGWIAAIGGGLCVLGASLTERRRRRLPSTEVAAFD